MSRTIPPSWRADAPPPPATSDQAHAPTRAAYTVLEFCQEHGGISKVFFYALLKQGKGPRVMKVGRRTLISAEAAADWRRRMEDETAGAAGEAA